MKKHAASITCLIVCALFFNSCTKDNVKPAEKQLAKKTHAGPITLTDVQPRVAKIYSAVRIKGTNFSAVKEENVVEFNGVQAIVTYATDTMLTVTLPGTATTGKIKVTVDGASFTTPSDFKVLKPVKDLTVTFGPTTYITKIAFDKVRKGYLFVTNGEGVFQLAPNGTITNIYNAPPDETSGDTTFNYAIDGIATALDGNVYAGLEKYNPVSFAYEQNIIIKITPAGVSSVAAGVGSGHQDGAGATAQFRAMSDFTSDYSGRNLYLAEDYLKIRRISQYNNVSTPAEISSGAQGKLAVDINSNIYFSNDGVIKKINPAGVITNVAGGIGGSQADGLKTEARFNGINSMAVDMQNLYLSDLRTDDYAFTLRVLNNAGYVSTMTLPDQFYVLAIDPVSDKLCTAFGNSLTVYSFK
ncbi:MAG: IPT/TIG domain-containing protein [Mucilaginibacter sp.]